MAKTPPSTLRGKALQDRAYWWWSLAAQLTRLPSYMVALAFVVAGAAAAGTFSLGGAMVTAYIGAQVCGAPWAGRWLDHQPLRRGISSLLALSTVVLLCLAGGLIWHSPAILLFLLAALAGGSTAGISGAMRALLSRTIAPEALSLAVAFDAIVIEIMVVLAPVLVSVVALLTPFGGVLFMAVLTALAALLVKRVKTRVEEQAIPSSPPVAAGTALWRSPEFLLWLFVSLAFGHVIGAVETCALPLSERLGAGTFGAPLLIGLIAMTSAPSGLLFAHLGHRVATHRLPFALLLLCWLAACGITLGLAANWWTTIGSVLLLGIGLAPLNVVRSLDVERVAPTGRASEAFSTVSAAHGVGYALGGLALALLPVTFAVASGIVSVLLALAAAGVLLKRDTGRTS